MLDRLTALAQELVGTLRPISIVELAARALTDELAPARLSVILLDVDTNRLTVAYHNGPRPAKTDEPLLQLGFRRGPLVFPNHVAARAAEHDVQVERHVPTSWMGVPIVVMGRTIGAVAIEGDRARVLDDAALAFARTVMAQAAIALENARLVERLQDQLLQSEKMSAIGQLIAGVAHDLNNPLASVVGFSDLLGEAADVPPRLAEPLAVIRQEAERASGIVRNLLSFARRQEGERQLQSIRPILESTHQLLRNQLMAARVELTLEFEPGLPEVEVHANQIKQVFVNIINNAAQAIATTRTSGGRIEIVTRCQPDGISVSITDNGPGMSDAVAQRVFEPFFSTKSEGEGTGLGLSISLGIVKEHGGSLTVDPSGAGRGATFTVELPTGVRQQGEGAKRPVFNPQARASDKPERLRVLVVDDEPHILHYMQATLESWGHDVVLARDGSQALKRALVESFDLIICDLRMPRLGGREMFHTLARMHRQVADRIIFATGDTVRGDTLQFLEELGRPFLQKPFKLDELRRVLAGVVRVPA